MILITLDLACPTTSFDSLSVSYASLKLAFLSQRYLLSLFYFSFFLAVAVPLWKFPDCDWLVCTGWNIEVSFFAVCLEECCICSVSVAIGVECSTVVYRILPHLSLSPCFSIWLTFVMHLWSRFSSVLWHCWLGGRKGIRPVKTWAVGCWCDCLSGARCRLACVPADATATRCLLLQ